MLTLISVANPWMFESPAPEISHSVAGFPVRVFSQTIGFDPGAQAPNAETSGRRARRLESARTTNAERINRLRHQPEGRLYLGCHTVAGSLRRTAVTRSHAPKNLVTGVVVRLERREHVVIGNQR